MADLKLSGLGVALVTPFNNDYSIDFKALEKLIENVIYGGCDYLVVLGTTAETPTLSDNERKDITNFIKGKVDSRVPLVIGIGGNNTFEVAKDIRSRDLDGYTAILSVTPYYNKPTQEGLYHHFKTLAESSPIPIVLYNVPGRTGVNMTSKTTLRLANTSEKFCGIKEASGDIMQCKEIIDNAPEHFSLISGDDSMVCSLMSNGAVGVISVLGNAFPSEVKKIVSYCKQNQIEKAKDCQNNLMPVIRHLFEDGNPAGVKYVLSKLGLGNNILRLPLLPVSKHVEDNLNREISLLLGNNS